MTLYKWLQASGSNASVDSTINWAEGQAPSTVNDSARAMMAAVAKYRDDIAGAIVTAGTSTAYTVSSYEVFDTLAHLNGQVIAFTPHVTNGATVTLNVDSLGAKPLRSAPNAGNLRRDTCSGHTVHRDLQQFRWRLLSAWLLCAIRTTCRLLESSIISGQARRIRILCCRSDRRSHAQLTARYFALVSTTYGTGDGSTTFNVPDLRGRVCAGKDDMGGSAANNITNAGSGIVGTTLGASGGAQTVSLAANQIPAAVPSTVSGVAVDAGGSKIITTNATPGNLAVSAGSGNIVPDVAVGQQFSFPNSLSQTGTGTASSNNRRAGDSQ